MKLLDFSSYLALNETEAFYTKLPGLVKNKEALRSEVIKAIKAAGLSADIFRSGLSELKTGKLKSQLSRDTVKVLQMLLGLKADGAYGPSTKQAVQNFQKDVLKFGESDVNKMKRPDGVWGPETAKAAFGDKDAQGPIYALQLITGETSTESKIFGAAREILVALAGDTEDEDAVYDAFKNHIKTKGDFEELERIWNGLKVGRASLVKGRHFYKNQSLVAIQKANAGVKNPMTLSQAIREYFNTEEINRLNSYLPAEVEKF